MKQMLLQRWLSLFPSASRDRLEKSYETIWRHYTESHRTYHDIHHIIAVLEALDTYFMSAPRAVELALWLHDLIYTPGDPANERLSADEGSFILKNLGEEPQFMDEAYRAIVATQQHIATSRVEQIVCDIDLLSLAAPLDKYQNTTALIRREFSDFSDAQWVEGRFRFINRFLDRETIFQTEEFFSLFESQARRNLESERDRLLTN